MTHAAPHVTDPLALARPRREIHGISAVLLPFTGDRHIDKDAFAAHVARTAAAGITPAVNMDTGYVHLLDDALHATATVGLVRGTRGDPA